MLSMRTQKRKQISEGGLPPGYYTLGDGHVHKVPTSGYSKWYKRGDMKYRYNNAKQCIEVWYEGEHCYDRGLNFMDWVENPDYWIDTMRSEDSELASMYADEFADYMESNKVNEADEQDSFVIAYREGGQDKYSSVKANSSTDALRIFNQIIDKSGRNVSNAHIAVEDMDLSEEINGLPPMQKYKVIRTFDGEDIELAKVEARNEEEAKANMMVALMDAGYYEGEVSPEIEKGIIRVVRESSLKEAEDDGKKYFLYTFSYPTYDEDDRIFNKRGYCLVKAESTEDSKQVYEDQAWEYLAERLSADGTLYNSHIKKVYNSYSEFEGDMPGWLLTVFDSTGIVDENVKIEEDTLSGRPEVNGYNYHDDFTEELKCHDDMKIYHLLQSLPMGTRIYCDDKTWGILHPDQEQPAEIFYDNYDEKTGDDEWSTVRDGKKNGSKWDNLHYSWFFSDEDFENWDWPVYTPV